MIIISNSLLKADVVDESIDEALSLDSALSWGKVASSMDSSESEVSSILKVSRDLLGSGRDSNEIGLPSSGNIP